MKRCILLFSKDYESQVNYKYIVVCMNGWMMCRWYTMRRDTDIPISYNGLHYEQLMADTDYKLILAFYCSVIS